MTQNTKISNIPWIWEIPEDWKIQRLKSVILRSKNWAWWDDPKWDSNDIACIRVADFDSENFWIDDSNLTYRNIPDCEDILLNEGDLLLEKSWGWDLQLVWRVINYNKPFRAVTSNFLATIKIKKSSIENKFLYYLLRYFYSVNINYRSIKQTTGIQNLDSDSYFQEPIPLPPLHIQTIIANFLDQKTEQISTLISNKKKLINLLKEQKQSIIHQAVTKGIDSSAKMKDSGIPWIGEIPEDWEVVKLKYLGRIRSWDGIENTQIKSEWDYEVYWWNGFMGYTDTYNVSEMSIIIGRVGAKCWNVRLINERKWISDNALVLSLFNSDNYNFLAQLLEIMNLNTLSVSNAQPLITGTVVMNQFIPLPSSSVQYKIFEYVKQETSQIDFAIEKIEKEIILIEEYQTSLIYQAVTGKISIS